MLSKSDLRWNLEHLKILSTLNMFPFKVNLLTGHIEVETRALSRALFHMFFTINLITAIFYSSTSVVSLAYDEYFDSRLIIFHLATAAGTVLALFWTICLYMLWPDVTVKIFNFIMAADPERAAGDSIWIVQNGFKWSKQSARDLILFLIYGALPFFFIIFLLMPDRIFTVYIFIPPRFQNSFVYVLCTLLDIVMLGLEEGIGVLALLMQLLFFAKVGTSLRDVERSVRTRSFQQMSTSIRNCRRIQLVTQLFNHNFAPVIFSFKLFAISGSILLLLISLIFLRNMSIFLASMTIPLSIVLIVAFTVTYDKAFEIPGQMERLKNALRVSGFLVSPIRSAYWGRVISSIPDTGIRVGSFHTLERVSTPNFVDYVFTELVNILLAYNF